jgi:hypothetical protein
VAVRQVAGSTGFDAVDIEDGTGVGVRTGPDDPTVPTAGAVASTPALLDHGRRSIRHARRSSARWTHW